MTPLCSSALSQYRFFSYLSNNSFNSFTYSSNFLSFAVREYDADTERPNFFQATVL